MAARALLLNLAAFQLGWFACVLGAAHGLPAAGPLLAAALVALHLWLGPAAARHGEALLVAGAAALGFVLDSLLADLGYIAFADGAWAQGLAPPWMVAMWALFATTLNVSLRWLHGRIWLATGLGALAGPAAYAGGAALGAADWPAGSALGLAAVAIAWAWALPALLISAARLRAGSVRARSPRDGSAR